MPLDVTGLIPKFGVPLRSAVDGLSSFLAEPKRVTSVGLEPLVAAVVAEEPFRPTFAWVQFTVNADFSNEFEVVVADVQVVVFTEGDAAVFPKLNKLLVVSVTSGFTALITVLADDELKPPLALLLSDADPWPACSLEYGGVLDPLHMPRSGVEEVTSCGAPPADILVNEFVDSVETCEDCLPNIKEIPEEQVVATFLKGSIFCSVGAAIFVEGGVSVDVGFFCSAKTKVLAGDDDVNVGFGTVWFNREVTGADVTDSKNPKPVFAALVFGTAGEMLFGIISETLFGK
jgi:hypothetical protein